MDPVTPSYPAPSGGSSYQDTGPFDPFDSNAPILPGQGFLPTPVEEQPMEDYPVEEVGYTMAQKAGAAAVAAAVIGGIIYAMRKKKKGAR